jgi:RNA polymerase sigma-70 factor (ECF subfamily)
MTEKDDTILIQETINGNQGAQKILYDKYKKIVKDYLRNKYRQHIDIEDDISEIMINVFLNLSSFDESKSKFKTWVLFVARNHMIDKWRSNSITLTSFNSGEISTDSVTCTNFEYESSITLTNSLSYSSTNTANFENNNSLNYLSSQISPSEYMMLDMKYLQGFNYDEIGKEFNLTSSTVSNKVNYIKTKLKKNYSEIFEE